MNNSLRDHMEKEHDLHEAGSLSEGVLIWLHTLVHKVIGVKYHSH